MQPWLHPMHGMTSSAAPAAAFASRSGSAIIARVIPTRSTAPVADQSLGGVEVGDPRRADERHARDRGAHVRHRPGDRLARLGRRRDDVRRSAVGPRVAEGGGDEVDLAARAQRRGDLGARLGAEPVGRDLVGGEADADRDPVARRGPDGGEQFAARTAGAPRGRRCRRRRACSSPARRTGRRGSRAPSRPRSRRRRPRAPGGRTWRSRRRCRRSPPASARAARRGSAGSGRPTAPIAGGSGGSAICSRPPCRSCTKSRAPLPRTAAPRRS